MLPSNLRHWKFNDFAEHFASLLRMRSFAAKQLNVFPTAEFFMSFKTSLILCEVIN